MKPIAWLAGIGTLVPGTAYMLVSLHRWEWNRALFFGLIVVIAEIGLATGLVLRKLGQMAAPRPPDAHGRRRDREARAAPSLPTSAGSRTPPAASSTCSSRSSSAAASCCRRWRGCSIAWRRSPRPRSSRGGWRGTSTPSPIRPAACWPTSGRWSACSVTRDERVARVALGVIGLVPGGAAVLALREATLSTHEPRGRRVADGARGACPLAPRRAEPDTSPRWSRPCW